MRVRGLLEQPGYHPPDQWEELNVTANQYCCWMSLCDGHSETVRWNGNGPSSDSAVRILHPL